MPVLIAKETLHRFLIEVFAAAGCDAENARIAADGVLEADLRGHGIQGTGHLAKMIDELTDGPLNGKARPFIRCEKISSATVDGDRAIGFVAGRFASEVAIQKARQAGAAAIGVIHSGDIFMLGLYAQQIASAGLVGIVFTNGAPRVRAPGGIDPVLGTNPIAFSFPMEAADPLVIDFATSAISVGHVRTASDANEPIGAGLAIDRGGAPTIDATEALEGALNPFGDYKGFGLGLAIALLSGPMVGAAVGAELKAAMQSGQDLPPRGHLFLALDPAAFGDVSTYSDRARRLLSDIGGSRKASGVDEIRIPGERSHRARQRALDRGVELPESVWERAISIARKLGVSPPSL